MDKFAANMSEADIKSFSASFAALEAEVSRTIVGQKDMIRNVLTAMIMGGNILLEGLPGLGKTQLVKSVAKALDLRFSRIQFTPDLMPSDITGTDIVIKAADGSSGFQFQKGPIFSNIVLADEINRATPKTQSSLLEAMQERTVTVGGTTYELPSPFFVLATQNPFEMEGTYPLPEAQMDRFMFKIDVKFPDKDELLEILNITSGLENEPRRVLGGEALMKMRETARQVPIAKAVAEYAVLLILKSHPESEYADGEIKKYVRYGSSPRGAQALVSAAKVYALLDGRYNVSYADINLLAYPVLRHRIFLNFEALADGITADDMIAKLTAGGA